MPVNVLNTDAQLNGKTLVTTEDAQVVTGVKTFELAPAAPFVVEVGSAVVPNLDADKLDGQHAPAGTLVGTSDVQALTNKTLGAGCALNIDGLISSSGQPRAQARHSTSQNITDAAWTTLIFDTDVYDVGACHDPVTNNSRLTVPAGAAGLYLVMATITFAANATGIRGLRFALNGSAIEGGVFQAGISGSGVGTGLNLVTAIVLTAGQYMEAQAFQSSGGALAVGALAGFRSTFTFIKIL